MQTPRTTQTQFSLRSLLIVTTIFAALFALLAAIGISPQHVVVGFAVLGTVIVLQAAAVEAVYRMLGLR